MERSLSLRSSGVQGVRGVQEANCGAVIGPRPVERCLALVLRLVRRSLGEVGSFSEGGCEADRSGRVAIRARERSLTTALR
jgi:hypothetical protein